MTDHVYHFTGSYALPYILRDEALRSFPHPVFPVNFLWATSARERSKAASVFADAPADIGGRARVIRFTLPASEFETWPQMVARTPAWTPDKVAKMELIARREFGDRPESWFCRSAPLSMESVIRIEHRPFGGGAWQRLEPPIKVYNCPGGHYPELGQVDGALGVLLGEDVYLSRCRITPLGSPEFQSMPPQSRREIEHVILEKI